MPKCGKGCMPECEYFMTGGCTSPFNCQYKIETGYINSATSIPTYISTYMEKQMSMTAEEIEHCLERFTMGKTTDVMNFDYAGTLAYIQRLKAENAELTSKYRQLELTLFTVVRNFKVLPVGLSLGKTKKEITDMTFATIEKIKQSIDYNAVEKLLQGEEE